MDWKQWKNSKYFLNLVKHHQTLNVITEPKSHNGETINKTYYIIGEMVNFYTSSYACKNIPNGKINDYVSNIDVMELNTEGRNVKFAECI